MVDVIKRRRRPPKNFVFNRVIRSVDDWYEIEVRPKMLIKIDAADYETIKNIKWHVALHPSAGILIKSSSRLNGKSGEFTLQAFLLRQPKGMFPRFVNPQDRLDFRRSNLEVVSVQIKNLKEGKRKAPTSSIYRGVSITPTLKWRAGIQVNGVSHRLGTFDSESEAAIAYNEASRFYYGELGFQNDVPPRSQRTGSKKK